MLKVNKFNINSKKINNITIAFLSDIHYDENFDINLEKQIIEKVKLMVPNYIIITGDIIDKACFLDEEFNKDKLVNFIKKLSFITKTFFILGGHDLEDKKEQNYEKYKKIWHKIFDNKENISLLDNDIYTDNNVNIIGITLDYEYYRKKPYENVSLIINELKKDKYKVSSTKYNILLLHSPRRILTKKAIDNIPLLSNIDLVLCGHMHDGVLPKFLKWLPTSIGLISPHKTPFPRYARGMAHKKINNDIFLIVSSGVTKISNSTPKFIQKLKWGYDNDIECIKVSGKNE